MATGWRKVGGFWYYLNPNGGGDGPKGGMLTGLREIGQKVFPESLDGSRGAQGGTDRDG